MPPTTLLILTLLAAATAEPSAPPPPAKLEFPLAGYRINALDSPANTTFVFSMPLLGSGNGRSSPSVKVDRRVTMKERPSYQNIKDAKTLRAHNDETILSERTVSPTEWQMEYTTKPGTFLASTGTKTTTKTHTYQRMVTANGMTYNISTTAPDAQWAEVGPKLKACVDSFELSAVPAPGKVVLPQQGYRISKLDGAVPAEAHEGRFYQDLLSMGNVHVGIKPYTKTLKDYQAEQKPRAMFAVGQIKILAENMPSENTLVMEYAEEIPAGQSPTYPKGARMLVCEKVVLAHGQLYSASATYWDYDKTVSYAQLKTCVDSLEAMPIPAPAPASTK